MKQIMLFALFAHTAVAMLIPEDAEMLDGYGYISYPEISPEDDYFEARSLSAGPLFHSVRNKRAINHENHGSNGLVNNLRPNTVNGLAHNMDISAYGPFRKIKNWLKRKWEEDDDDFRQKRDISNIMQSITSIRQRRSLENEMKTKTITVRDEDKSKLFSDSLTDRPSAAALAGKFVRSPFEYSKIQHEEDSMAMDSMSINEGMKSRSPRVNFVTQQKKLIDHDDTKTSATKSDFYKTPPLLHNSKESTATSSDKYPERTSTTRPIFDYKDQNSNRYDDRYIEDMYPPPPQSAYDPMYDYNVPYDMIRGFQGYNNYPGGRYDIPDHRDYPPMYGNEIDNRYYMRTDMMQPLPPSSTLPRKRTIYYAYLPEVVRSPPTVDFRYRSYDRYDPYYPDYYNPYEANMASGTYRRPMYDRFAISDRPSMKRDYRTSRPMKAYTEDASRNTPSAKEKRFDQDGAYRKSNEHDSFYY